MYDCHKYLVAFPDNTIVILGDIDLRHDFILVGIYRIAYRSCVQFIIIRLFQRRRQTGKIPLDPSRVEDGHFAVAVDVCRLFDVYDNRQIDELTLDACRVDNGYLTVSVRIAKKEFLARTLVMILSRLKRIVPRVDQFLPLRTL